MSLRQDDSDWCLHVYSSGQDCLRRILMNFFSSLSPLVHLTSLVSTSLPSSAWARARYHPLGALFPSFPPLACPFPICPSSGLLSLFASSTSSPGQVQVPPSCSHKALWAIAPPTPSALSAPPPAHLRIRLRATGTSWRSPPTVDTLPRRILNAAAETIRTRGNRRHFRHIVKQPLISSVASLWELSFFVN